MSNLTDQEIIDKAIEHGFYNAQHRPSQNMLIDFARSLESLLVPPGCAVYREEQVCSCQECSCPECEEDGLVSEIVKIGIKHRLYRLVGERLIEFAEDSLSAAIPEGCGVWREAKCPDCVKGATFGAVGTMYYCDKCQGTGRVPVERVS